MEHYQLQKELGSGSFGRVVRAHLCNQPQRTVAIKMIKMNALNEKEKDSALNEIRLLASIDSPNVIAYQDAFYQNSSNTLCIVMEYADGGDLARMISRKRQKNQKFNENFIWQVAYDLLKALKTLHTNKIIHRDLKPGNVFFVDGVAKLGDLNISKVAEGGFASTQAGTPFFYTGPQIWNGQLYDGRCDIWSLGCLLYECASLRPPFMANDFPSLSYYDPIPAIYSKRLADVIRSCLKVNFRERPTAAQITADSVFQYMHSNEEGSVNLLNTIRCPRILKMIQQKLPEAKSHKKQATFKDSAKLLKDSGKLLKDSGRLSPPPVDIRKLVSEQKMRPRLVSKQAFQKENQSSKMRPKQIVGEEGKSRGILYKVDSQMRQRGAMSPTIYRRIM